MCGHLPILIARCASKRFQWLMAMIGLPTGESLLGSFVGKPAASHYRSLSRNEERTVGLRNKVRIDS
jgi:hypothetical protein